MAKFQRIFLARVQTQGETFTRVFDHPILLVGRTSDTQIAVADTSVSRHHLEIKIRSDHLWLTDLGSANGTFINGEKIEPHKRLQYQEGDVIRVGNQNTEIQLEVVEKAFQDKDLESQLLPEEHRTALNALINAAHAESQRLQTLVKSQEEQMIRAAEAKAHGIVNQATITGNSMVDEATDMAQSIQADAEKKRAEMIAKAEQEAIVAASDVFAQADAKVAEGEKKAKALISEAETTSAEILKQARQHQLDLSLKWETEKASLYEKAQEEIESQKTNILTAAKSAAQILIDEAQNESAKILKSASEQFNIAKSDAEQKAVVYYKDAAEKLKSAEAELESAKTDARKILTQGKMNADALKIEADYNLQKAREEAQEIEARALEESKQLQMNAHLQKAQLLTEADGEARRIIDEAKAHSQELLQNGKKQVDEWVSRANADIALEREAILSKAQADAKTLLASSEAEIEIKRQKLLGSIELAKLETEKFNQDARNHLLDVVQTTTETKRQAEAQAELFLSEAKSTTEKMLSQTEEQKKSIIEKTEQLMQAKLQAVQSENDAILKNAKRTAEKMAQDASETAERMVAEAKAETEGVRHELQALREQRTEIQKSIQDLLSSKAQIQSEIQVGGERVSELMKTTEVKQRENLELENNLLELKNQKINLTKELNQAQTQLAKEQDTRKQILIELESVKTSLTNSKEAHQAEIERLKSSVKKEIDEYKNREQQSLDERKMSELQLIKKMRDEAHEGLKAQREELAQNIANAVEVQVLAQVKSGQTPSSDLHLLFQNQIKGLISEELFKNTFDQASKNETYLPPPAVQKINRRLRYGGIGATLVLAGCLAYSPTRHSIVRFFTQGSQAAVDGFIQAMKAERDRRYRTEKTREWRASYTDAVLYTKGFVDFKLSSESQKLWIKKLQDHMLEDHKVSEDATIKLIALEAALVTQLKDSASQIHPESVDSSIKKMRELEAKVVGEMQELLGDTKNFEDFKKFSENYYTHDYLPRMPASVDAEE